MTKSNNSKAVSKQVVQSMVRRAIINSAEQKGLQFLQSGTGAATGVVATICALAQGDGVSDRTGTVITPISLDVMLETYVGAYTDALRCIIFVDTKFDGATPAASAVLATDFIGANYNFLNVVQEKRFRILYDKTVSLNGNGKAFEINHTVLKNIPKIHYDASSNLDSSIAKNALCSLVIGYSTHVGYALDTQLRFIDMQIGFLRKVLVGYVMDAQLPRWSAWGGVSNFEGYGGTVMAQLAAGALTCKNKSISSRRGLFHVKKGIETDGTRTELETLLL